MLLPLLLAYFVEDYGIRPLFLMRNEASFRVFGSSRPDAVLTATLVGHLQGDGTGEQIQTLGYNRRVFGFDLK